MNLRRIFATAALIALAACSAPDPSSSPPCEGDCADAGAAADATPDAPAEPDVEGDDAPDAETARSHRDPGFERLVSVPKRVEVQANQIARHDLYADTGNGGETHWRCAADAAAAASTGNGGETHWRCDVADNGGETHWRCWNDPVATRAAADTGNGGETHWRCTARDVADTGNGGETHWRCVADALRPWRCAPIAWDMLSLGRGFGCGLSEGRVLCWGDHQIRDRAPEGADFVRVAAGDDAVCAINAEGRPTCWNRSGQTNQRDVFGSNWTGWTMARGGSCGRRGDGEVTCWHDPTVETGPPPGPYLSIDAAGHHTCGLTPEGAALCWGSLTSTVVADAPQVSGLKAVTVGDRHACWLDRGGLVGCWGEDDQGQVSAPDEGPWEMVAARGAHTCALTPTGSVRCWGANAQGQLDVVPGEYAQVVAGAHSNCGLDARRFATCWGRSHVEEVSPVCDAAGFAGIAEDNACGGCDDLGDAPLIEACGVCGEGKTRCVDANALGCFGDIENACGGCRPLTATPGQACGGCDGGRWRCDGADSVQCSCGDAAWDAVAAGQRFTCGLTTAGDVRCWGRGDRGQLDAPDAPMTAIAAGWSHACGVRASDGLVSCWGWDRVPGLLSPPSEALTGVVVGEAHACGLNEAGLPRCWGQSNLQQLDAPNEPMRILAAGRAHTCGLRLSDDTPVCWGDGALGQLDAPAIPLESLTAGSDHTCGLDFDGAPRCWGDNTAGQLFDAPGGDDPLPPGQELTTIAAAAVTTCAQTRDGTLRCVGDVSQGQDRVNLDGQPLTLTSGYDHLCGVTAAGQLTCWGGGDLGQTRSPRARMVQLAAGVQATCGLDEGGNVSCWGALAATEPRLATLSLGRGVGCGVDLLTQALTCWGPDPTLQTGVPEGEFVAVSVGSFHACALRADQTIACWGEEASDRLRAPLGRYREVSVGDAHACALDLDRRLSCWGNDLYGQLQHPDGAFLAVTSGSRHACALGVDGRVTCWGLIDPLTVPEGRFAAIAAGQEHTCALPAGGGATVCWGDGAQGQTAPLPGASRSLTAGDAHTCALDATGSAICTSMLLSSDSPR